MSDDNSPVEIIDTCAVSTEVNPRALLPEEELRELQRYENEVLTKDPRRTLAPVTAQKFFALFLQGYTPKEIHDLNPTFPLGLVIHARVKFCWDEERDRHIRDLMGRTKEKIMLTQLESANYLADVIAATHKLNGTKIKKFLQTDNPEELAGLKIDTLFNYSKVLDTLAKLIGQGKGDKNSPPPINVFIPAAQQQLSSGSSSSSATMGASADERLPISPDDAAKVMRALLEIRKVKDSDGE